MLGLCPGEKSAAATPNWRSEMTQLSSREEFEEKIRALLASRYHHRHPFHVAMHEGKLSWEELQDWVANRFCYQQGVVIKDAILLSKLPSREERRVWIR